MEQQTEGVAEQEQAIKDEEDLENVRGQLKDIAHGIGYGIGMAEMAGGMRPRSTEAAEERYKMCEQCKGTGKRWFFFKCPVCKGSGRVLAARRVERSI